MRGTAQADSAFTCNRCSKVLMIRDQLAITRHSCTGEEGKTGQAVELVNQLPQELNDTQRREKHCWRQRLNWRRRFCWRAKLAGENHTCRFRTKPASPLLAGKIDASPGRRSIDLLRALIAQEPLLGAKEKQQNIDAHVAGALLHDSGAGEYAGDQRRRKYSARLRLDLQRDGSQIYVTILT